MSSCSSSIEAEYNEINQRNGWHQLFQEIREKCEKEAKDKNFSIRESTKNTILNRYRDVNPYDHSRIILHRGNIDYINANLVKMEKTDRKYILTQGPLKETVGHFWLMIWEHNSKAILMLNKIYENKQLKCYKYWPDKIGENNAQFLTDVGLKIQYLTCENYTNFSLRKFRLTDVESNKSKEIIQFHYITWPDFGIPSSPVAFLQFLKKVRDSGALDPDVGPAVVHCSAGIGRSGTFCLVDCCLVLIEKNNENMVSVREVLYELRRYRMGLIQTADQLYFSYQAIIEGSKLLQDPSFINYWEVPNNQKEEQQVEETPPPLPPRTHSLQHQQLGVNTKSLPPIPNSESFNEEVIFKDRDAINNFINNEKYEFDRTNRPLPPPPTQLQKQNSSDCSGNYGNSDDDSDITDNENSDDNSNSIDEDSVNGNNDNDDNDDNDDDDGNNDNDNDDDDDSPIPIFETVTTKMHNLIDEKTANAGLNGNDIGSDSNELRRRKRTERQMNIEQKVNEIKRKQREMENEEKSSKKRRSLYKYLAAGVIVGVFCVYAYTKLA